MTEILTESFCERCGTRYTFESARPRVRLKGVKVFSRGLKNFVLSDDTSLDEAMAAARSETDREATAHQLDAFHKTFNFCMSCRQYTCPNCWNEPEARCLTCAPLALPETPVVVDDLRAFRDAVLGVEPASANGTTDQDHAVEEAAAGPAVTEAVGEVGAEPAEPEAPAAAAGIDVPAGEWAESAPIEELVDAVRAEAAPEPVATEPVAEATQPTVAETAEPGDQARKAAAQTSSLLKRFRPGQSLDAELDAFERARHDQAAAGATTPEAGAAAAEPAEAVAAEPAPEPEPDIAAAAGPEPEAVTEPEPAPVAEAPTPEPAPLAAASGTDLVEQPTWRITAPDSAGTPFPSGGGETGVPLQPTATPRPAPDAEPQWPARPQWPDSQPAAGLPFLGRPAAPQGGVDALWAASNQELTAAVPTPQGRATSSGIQPCVSCGLSLSANARFCRRCGTLQAR